MEKDFDINIDMEDLKLVLSHEGSVCGKVGKCKISEFENEFCEKLKEDIKKSKGGVIMLNTNADLQLSKVSELVNYIVTMAPKDADFVFGTNMDNELDLETVVYRLVLTGV